MNIKIIQYELSAYHPQLILGSDEEEIAGVRVLPDDFRQTSFSAAADLLYLATDRDALTDLKERGICNLVYLLKDADRIEEGLPGGMNVILIPSEENDVKKLTLSIFNTITHILQDNERYNKCADIIFKSNLLLSKQHYHIDEVADVIYEILGNPFSLCNSEGVFLASK